MRRLTTHVLDTSRGRPAAGVAITLRRDGVLVAQAVTNADGRCDAPLLEDDALRDGVHELIFDVGAYFALPEPRFLTEVTVRFTVAPTDGHLHVPLLVTPWSHATYRGS